MTEEKLVTSIFCRGQKNKKQNEKARGTNNKIQTSKSWQHARRTRIASSDHNTVAMAHFCEYCFLPFCNCLNCFTVQFIL